MKKYFIIGSLVAFVVIFNLGYVFHEILMGNFFMETIGPIQLQPYVIPLIALAFILYTFFQAYFFPVYYTWAKEKYKWSLTKTAVIFGAMQNILFHANLLFNTSYSNGRRAERFNFIQSKILLSPLQPAAPSAA